MGTTHGADGRGDARGRRIQAEGDWVGACGIQGGGQISKKLLTHGAQRSYLLGRHWEGSGADGNAPQ